MIRWLLLLLISLMIGKGVGEESRLVNIEQGPVIGDKDPGYDTFVFYSIPYATAPVGEDKYKAPLPPPSWKLPFKAVNKNITCPQMAIPELTLSNTLQQDDCLIANVYVPDIKRDKLPVLVQIHGGAYLMGRGDMLTLKEMIKQTPMIVVNFNYRLGPLGFLCLGTPDAPGNAGMKDQVALLRWVKKNIASFGGNPDDVTVTGYSAGCASVELLLLSPMTHGLFNKVIPESGSSLSAFSVQVDPIENAKRYAKMINFTNSDDISALEVFYKTVPRDVLYSINLLSLKDSAFLFAPCVERDLGQERFLHDAPINLLKNGRQQKLPMLYGFSEMEGLFRIGQFDVWKNDMNNNFSDFVPADLRFDSEEKKEAIAHKIKTFFFGKQSVSNETIFRYIDYFTDVLFAYGTLRSIKLQVESGNNNIYLYEFRFVDDSAPLTHHTVIRGANHCDQTFAVADAALFVNPNDILLSEDYKKMKKLIRTMWANFITTGKPVPEEAKDIPYWPPTQANGGPHMAIDKAIKLQGPLLQQRFLFWSDIYEKYYNVPSPPAAQTPDIKS